jgi:hypothetical protein
MRALFWIAAAAAGIFALLLGLYVHVWLADTWPENLVFYGYRLTVFLLIGGGLAVSALIAFSVGLVLARRREPAFAGPDLDQPPEGSLISS